MPEISVIVPVYKVEKFLCRCVDSIQAQSYPEFELILVDDGSPDSCGAICEEYAAKDSRIHVIHQQNGGLSAARNSGICWAFAHSDSQWLAFVDSDDWVHPEYLEYLYRAARETGSEISACGFYRTEGETLSEKQEFSCEALTADDYYCTTEIHGGTTAVAWNKLYRKSLFENLRYPAGKLHEDEFTTYKAVYAAGSVAVTHAKLYAYYQNPSGIMQSKWNPRRMHTLEAVEQQIAFARDHQNVRFLNKAAEQYIFSAYEQLQKVCETPEHKAYRPVLRKKLREGLKQGRELGIFPLKRETLWAYEAAYPAKPLWWLVSKVR